MEKVTSILSNIVQEAFKEAGYNPEYGLCKLSDRPDLCQYQCNGAMMAAKKYKTAPIKIAQNVVDKLASNQIIESVDAVAPGFINISLVNEFWSERLNMVLEDERCGVPISENPETVVVDYGGPNVAKPLHVGHLRPAIIGESIKRIAKFQGHNVIGDAHLGDWGLQIGLIITELKYRHPDWSYFSEECDTFPEEPPFTITDLEEIYPFASKRSKEEDSYRDEARNATFELQQGRAGYRALWKQIINVSVTDLKMNYKKLNVEFDLWKGESDCQDLIPSMVEKMKADGYAYISDGALVVDVQTEADTRVVPPCMILKSDGAAQYATTDLATIIERKNDFKPQRIIYVVDKRQEMHFTQVFRCAYKTGIIDKKECNLEFVGFGTMNGRDGKPFKTRDGGVMRLETLISDVESAIADKMVEDKALLSDEQKKIVSKVALSAIKYGDLSNVPAKDYIFDVDRFSAFEGNTGPYILYTMVRLKSVLSKYAASYGRGGEKLISPESPKETEVYMILSRFDVAIEDAYNNNTPSSICHYIYELCNALNQFYSEHNILKEQDLNRKKSYIALIAYSLRVLETSIDLLGFSSPDKM